MALDEESRSFRTKTGTCTITDDRMVLSREGMRGVAAHALVGSSISRPLIVYVAVAAISAFSGVRSILDEQLVMGAFLCLFSLFLVHGIVRSRGLTAVPEILLSSIQRVEAHRPRPPLTRGYFVVHFLDNGLPRKRLVMLPGSLSGGGSEFAKALRVLEASGLMKT